MGIPYGDTGWPVPLEVFTRYALAFQKQLVPDVEDVMVERIERDNGGFGLHLAVGASFRARKVVLAAGLEQAAYVPPALAQLPAELVSHSSAFHDLSAFRGKDVTIIGAGQSALETAALLAELGAGVRLLVRERSLVWNPLPRDGRRSLYKRLRSPASGLGCGLQLWAYSNLPGMFRCLPQSIRFERAKHVLGPAGGWWLKERVAGQFPVLLEHVVIKAEERRGAAILHVRQGDGQVRQLATDHVIAATGYRFNLDRLPFLSPALKSLVRTERESPVLSSYFESAVPGLYFTGLASAPTFGPAMRFLYGADFTARRISRHFSAGQFRRSVQSDPEFAHAAKS
jgi:cation diffusion facilitator CzcD-associated flavoprotein CzcO